LIISTKSIPKVEKVVKPPQKPTIQNAFKKTGSVKPLKTLMRIPIIRAPKRLAAAVLQIDKLGKKEGIEALRTEPNPPPSPTNKKYWKPIEMGSVGSGRTFF
jgi:hypothetical protein